MEAVQQWLSTLVDFMGESKVLGAVIIMAGALIAAKVFAKNSPPLVGGAGEEEA